MYIIELKREHRLINYLEVNKSLPCDNESVGVFLQDLPTHKRNRILYIDKLYQKMAYICITFFVGNTIFSGFIVYDYYLDNQTTTTFVTNVLFMVLKIVDICMTINTDKNIFYSAYLKDKVQYNDVDPREKISNRLCDIVKNDDDENIIVPYKNIQNNRNYNRFIEDVGVELKIFDGVL
jgi:ABC-type antimicrobial peptide transport system permease subunit